MMVEFNIGIEGSNAGAALISSVDKDNTGCLTFDNFVEDIVDLDAEALREGTRDRPSTPVLRNLVGEGVKESIFNSMESAKRGFSLFDRDGGGDVSYMEFRDGMKNLGLPLQPDQIKQLFLDAAKDIDTNLTIEDFATSLGMDVPPRPKEVPRWDKRLESESCSPNGNRESRGGGTPKVQTLDLDTLLSKEHSTPKAKSVGRPLQRPMSSTGHRLSSQRGARAQSALGTRRSVGARPMSSCGSRMRDSLGGVFKIKSPMARPHSSAGSNAGLIDDLLGTHGTMGADLLVSNQTAKHNWQEEVNMGHSQNYMGPPRTLSIDGMLMT